MDEHTASNLQLRFTGGRVMTWLRDGDAGNAIVELAFTVPILALLLMGLFKTGMAFNNYLILQNAVSQGTYSVANNASDKSNQDPCKLANTAVSSVTPQFSQVNVKYAMKLNDSETLYTGSGSSFSCDLTTTGMKTVKTNYPVVLTVSYPVDMNIMGVDLMPGVLMSATAQQNVQVFLQ